MKIANFIVSIFSALFAAIISAPLYFFGLGASLVTFFIAAIDSSSSILFAGSAGTLIIAILETALSIAVLAVSIVTFVKSRHSTARKYATGCGVVCGLTLFQVLGAVFICAMYFPILPDEYKIVVLWPVIGGLFLLAMILLTVFATKKIKEDDDFQAIMDGYTYREM